MHDERRDRLAEDGLPPPEILDAWEVPDPSPDAIDRMFVGAIEVDVKPPRSEIPMHPRRSLLPSIATGFLVAAGLLLSFWLGRRSVEPQVVAPALPPSVEVVEPVIGVACPEPEAAPPAPGTPVPAPTPAPAPVACPEIQPVQIPIPFCPERAATPRPPRTAPTPGPSASSPDLKNPFGPPDEPPPKTRLHIGTNKGVAPAKVWIDGKPKGKTPLPNVKVTPGEHSVLFRWNDGREITVRVEVEEGESEVVRAG